MDGAHDVPRQYIIISPGCKGKSLVRRKNFSCPVPAPPAEPPGGLGRPALPRSKWALVRVSLVLFLHDEDIFDDELFLCPGQGAEILDELPFRF